MPRSIVDFSAISPIIKDEPFFLHFWESTPSEALEFMKNPRHRHIWRPFPIRRPWLALAAAHCGQAAACWVARAVGSGRRH